MPNKSKFRKNRKLKSKMKGGNAAGPGKEAPAASEFVAAPVAKATPPSTKPAALMSKLALARQFELERFCTAVWLVVVKLDTTAVSIPARASGVNGSRLTA